jgi:apurinic endonuclease APN1
MVRSCLHEVRSCSHECSFGQHISIPRNGLPDGFDETAVAFFIGPNQNWAWRDWTDDEVETFKKSWEKCGKPEVVVHGCYLINLPSEKEEVRAKSYKKLVHELKQCDRLGVKKYVLHPGICKDHETGVQLLREGLKKALDTTNEVKILIENMTGTNKLACTFEQLDDIINGLGDRVMACVDTAHCWGAGISMPNTLNSFEECVGLDKLGAIHLNDSKVKFGANLDRHEDLWDGEINTELDCFIMDPRVEGVPMILETPSNCVPKLREWLSKVSKVSRANGK